MEFIVGGYYLIQGAKLQEWMNAKLLPPMIWSASRCICEKVPDARIFTVPDEWLFSWTDNSKLRDERRKYQQDLGLTNAQFLELQKLFNTHFFQNEFGMPNVFMSYRLAYETYAQFFKKIPNLKLISIALPEIDVKDFNSVAATYGNYEYGVQKKLRKYQKVESDAIPIGYDVISYEYGDFHSLICGSMEQEIYSKYGVRFNSYGLIDLYEDTTSIIRDIRSGALMAEDGYWASWLLSEHSLP